MDLIKRESVEWLKKKEEKKRNQILVEKFILDKFEIYMRYIFLLLEMIIERTSLWISFSISIIYIFIKPWKFES